MAKEGRPTKYSPTLIKKVDEYLKQCVDEEYDWTKSSGDKSESWEHRIKVKLPTMEGFSFFIDTPIRTIYDWKDTYPDFSQSLEKIVKAQKDRLIEKGLSGDYNATIAKLILSSNHGMREKVDTDITTQGEKIQIQFDPVFNKKK